jgi:hypothetical protein
MHESAFGPKRTSLVAPHMSVFGSKADMEMTSYSTKASKHGSFILCACFFGQSRDFIEPVDQLGVAPRVPRLNAARGSDQRGYIYCGIL